MKNILTTLLFILMTTALTAQQRSMVKQGQTTYDDKAMSSQMITINAERDIVEESWDDFWDEKYDVDVDKADRDKNAVVYVSKAISLATVSDKTLDVYSKLTGSGKSTSVSLALGFGYDIVATADKNPVEFERAGKILDEFQTFFYTNFYGEKIENVRKELENVRDDREDAADDQSKSAKKIKKYREKIEKLERKIADEQGEIGEEEITEEDKMRMVNELEEKLARLERERRAYVN